MSTRSIRSFIVVALIIVAGLLGAIALPGCTSPDGYRTFVAAADVAVNQTIGPRYAAYVTADPVLTVEQKASFLNELQAFRSVVAEANKDAAPATAPPR